MCQTHQVLNFCMGFMFHHAVVLHRVQCSWTVLVCVTNQYEQLQIYMHYSTVPHNSELKHKIKGLSLKSWNIEAQFFFLFLSLSFPWSLNQHNKCVCEKWNCPGQCWDVIAVIGRLCRLSRCCCSCCRRLMLFPLFTIGMVLTSFFPHFLLISFVAFSVLCLDDVCTFEPPQPYSPCRKNNHSWICVICFHPFSFFPLCFNLGLLFVLFLFLF